MGSVKAAAPLSEKKTRRGMIVCVALRGDECFVV